LGEAAWTLPVPAICALEGEVLFARNERLLFTLGQAQGGLRLDLARAE
jgi:hypothetical protein